MLKGKKLSWIGQPVDVSQRFGCSGCDYISLFSERQTGDRLNVFLTDLGDFPLVNKVMAEYFSEPYPARSAVGVSALPKGAAVEMDAVMYLE